MESCTERCFLVRKCDDSTELAKVTGGSKLGLLWLRAAAAALGRDHSSSSESTSVGSPMGSPDRDVDLRTQR